MFQAIPQSGNCWCFDDKSASPKGATQDLYDAACKAYHACISCGYYSNITDYSENVIIAFDMNTTGLFTVDAELSEIVQSNEMLNYSKLESSVS